MNDNREITDLGIRALAAFVHEGRPEWDVPGIIAALRAERDGDVWQLAQRMIRRASVAANTSPRLQGFDAAETVGCRRHPGAAVRIDGACAVCFADSHADEARAFGDRGGRPIPADARAVMVAALFRPAPAEEAESA